MTSLPRLSPYSWAAALVLTVSMVPSHALYKVVNPDGTVTYTDRPPPAAIGKPTAPSAGTPAADAAATQAALPLELRQAMGRFPVTLYSSDDCAPCEAGRRVLQGRGIPFTERRVLNEDDAEALTRLSGGRSVPTLTIGSQALRGFSESDWQSYLDAAGYPRESRLPRSYRAPAATPLVQRQAEAPTAPAPAARAPEPVAPPPTTAPSPSGIRF
jgi:glutaredoxin